MEFPKEDLISLTVPRGYEYTAVHVPPTNRKPYLLFLHGFPESAYDWASQIKCFRGLGYGIVAPDLLGYGATSKPQDYREYRMKMMVDDVVSLLDELEIDKFVAIGHDWGCAVVTGLSAWYPDRVLAYAYLAVGYSPPGKFDIDSINAMTKQQLGYEAFGYFQFLGEPDSAKLLDKNLESSNALFFSEADPDHWKQNVCRPGAARAWLESGKTAELPPWLVGVTNDTRQQILAKGGYTGPSNWYKQALDDFNDEDAAGIPEANRAIKDEPVLFMLDLKPTGAMPSQMMAMMTKQFCTDLTVKEVDAGHFFMLEAPAAVNKALNEFLDEHYL